MKDKIYEELNTHIAIPELISRKLIIGETNEGIGKYLSTRQVIRLTKNETEDILHKINNKELDEGEYLRSLYIDYEYTEDDDKLYTNLKDAYGISEYFSSYNMYIPKRRYFNYICTHSESVGVFNIYNGFSANIPIESINSKISKSGREVIPGNFNFPEVRKIKYTEFTSSFYNKQNRINSYPLAFPAMCVNLPYKYYSEQYIPENIYTYDIDSKKYSFAGMDEETFIKFFNDICENGIRKSVYVQVRNGRIISASDEDYLIILIASYLKLPTIPVVIYMMNNNQRNQFLRSDRPADIAINNNRVNIPPARREMINLINEVCENNLIFYNSHYHGDLNSYNIMINNKRMNQFNYMPDIDIINTPADQISYVDFYLKNDPIENVGVPVDDIAAENKRILERAENNLNELINEKIEKMNQIIDSE